MIFITTGTVSFPFRRLVDKSIDVFKDIDEEIIIQSGIYKVKPLLKNIKLITYLPFEKTLKLYKSADLIISACGEVSTLLILKNAINKPIFVPRLKQFGEHVDDQQLLIANYFKEKGHAYVIDDISRLGKHISKRNRNNYKESKNELNNLIKNLTKFTLDT